MASLSGSRRPLPELTKTTTPTPPLKDGVGLDSGGRRHTSSSVPRTAVPPGPEKAALRKLKQKMTFSDHSASSSAVSTPIKAARTEPRPPRGERSLKSAPSTDPITRHKSHRHAELSASFVPASGYLSGESRDERNSGVLYSDYASEGEIPSSLTISGLLSKLDSVKNFLKEAEAMRSKFEDKKNEPGMPPQLNKLDKLIDQLQQQESGYLGELIRLTEIDDSKFNGSLGEDASYSEDESEEEEEEEEEEDSEEFCSDQNHTVLGGPQVPRRSSGSGNEGSTLSLRAETELEKQAEQELLALQKQKEMLTQLLEKQKQIQELEAKQISLLEMKRKAELELKEAEAKGQEIEKLSQAAKVAKPELDEREELMSKFSELQARKERVDQITELLLTLKSEEDLREVLGGDDNAQAPPPALPVAGSQDARAAESGRGTSELVQADKDADALLPSVEQLQMKLREAADARRKLAETQKLLAFHKDEEFKSGGSEKGEKLSWRLQDGGGRKKAKGGVNSGGRAGKMMESWMGEFPGEDGLDQSLVSDYEAKLSLKKEEVSQLLQEREELRATHNRLLSLKKKMHFRQFLDDPLPQNTDHEAVSQTDLTAATWGGSTVQSDPEDTATSVSLPSDIAADITQESNQNTEPPDHGEGATVEQEGRGKTPPFSVTRHTPRARANVRLRTQSVDSTEATLRTDKKMKIDPKVKAKGRKSGMLKNPLASAAFKAPFNSPPKATGVFSAGAPLDVSGGAMKSPSVGRATDTQQPPAAAPPKDDLLTEHTATLQNQLALTSHMCSQLLQGQNSLIRAVCERLDRPELSAGSQMEERMVVLQQYQMELEAYYHQLCSSYAQFQEANDGGGVPESEDPVVPANDTITESQQAQSAQLESGGACSFPSDVNAAFPPHLAHFYPPPSHVQPRPADDDGAMPTAESFLPPPPPPLGNTYASPKHWHPQFMGHPASFHHYPSPYSSVQGMPPYLGQTPQQFQERPPNPIPGEKSMPFPHPYGDQGAYPFQYAHVGLGTSFDGQGFPTPFRAGKEFGLLSPSGVTGSSMQVHAPSSPSAAPSVSVPNSVGAGNSSSAPAAPVNPPTPNESHVTQVQGVNRSATEGAAERKNGGGEETKGEVESVSSMPMSAMPGVGVTGAEGKGDGGGFSVFDTLRDTIYSEVATLIANNENRPHFLVELFRELQMLNTDYLRQRALYNLQDLVTRFLTEEAVASEANAAMDKQYQTWLGEVSGGGGDGSGSERDGEVRSKPAGRGAIAPAGRQFDYMEAVQSASSVSTPPDEPFASEDLGETVVKLNKTVTHMTHMKLAQRLEGGVIDTPTRPIKAESAELVPGFGEMVYPDVDTKVLDEQIKAIMIDVIPILKESLESECDYAMMVMIRDRVVNLVVEQEKNQDHTHVDAVKKQLEMAIKTAMEKYIGRKFRDCGEDLLLDISEVLFNELTFFKLMEDFKGHPQLNGDFRSVTSSQTTTEAEDNSFVEAEGVEAEPGGDPKSLDPALLQALSFAANLTLQDEEDTLGKSRDDSLATAWDPKLHSHEHSADEQDSPDGGVGVVELSVSESRPIQSVGSGDDEDGVTPRPGTGAQEVGVAKAAVSNDMTPPTLVAADGRYAAPDTAASEDGGVASPEGRNVSIGRVSAISKEDGTEMDHPIPALSPAVAVPSQEAMPQLSTLTQETLEAQMKVEQKSLEGVEGILSSMQEQEDGHDLGLVGEENEMAGPVNSNGI